MSALFNPLKLGSTTISNRIGMSPLTRNRSSATVPNEIMLKYYVQRATGGAGLIVTEGTLITPQGTEWPNAPGIWNEAQIAGWKKIVDGVHEAGSKMYAQIWHLGRLSHPDMPEQIKAGVPVYAPSALAARGGKFRLLPGEPGYVTPTEIADPTVLIRKFKEAAINAKKAGFDGVELHAANGYVVHQFLDSSSNKRTDKWGGSPENRARFALEILRELVGVFGHDVAMKISPAGGYNDMGMPLQDTIDTFGYLLREANKLGLAYVALMRYSPYLDLEFDGKKRATQHDVVETFRPFLPNVPVFVNAGYTSAEAEELVGGGKVAGVFFGMNWITHPDLGRRIKENKPLDNAPDYQHLYGAEGVDPALGYVDFKEATY
ncbi:flavoprotein NADH-dependent oxidoreductase [Mycena vitilis]|nr:flavoprotein NADH-dependent oxidoreductase [Mycena vitilis]